MSDQQQARYEKFAEMARPYPDRLADKRDDMAMREAQDVDRQVRGQIRAANAEEDTGMGGRKRRKTRGAKRKSRGGKRKTRRRA
jgi:hypothetical protein